jgi:olefin beta-lactone synthetase
MISAHAPFEARSNAERLNISERFGSMAQRLGRRTAVDVPTRAESISFRDLEARVHKLSEGFRALGVRPGDRCLMLTPPSVAFFATTFALFRAGAVPVFIDPSMGIKSFLASVGSVSPRFMVGVPRGFVAQRIFPRVFRSVQKTVLASFRKVPGFTSLTDVESLGDQVVAMTAETRAQDLAAILFTSGSTGPAKGVRYTHGVFNAQVDALHSAFGFGPEDVDLAVFPLFSLFSLALGAKVVVPDMDTSRPAAADPARVLRAFSEHGVTYAFGSPVFWDKMACHLERGGETAKRSLAAVRRLFVAGAPSPVTLLERLLALLPETADVVTPYGATECLPITGYAVRSNVREMRQRTLSGDGYCVGKPLAGMRVEVIPISEVPIADEAGLSFLRPGETGELVVQGPVVTPGYFERPDADQLSKVSGALGVWHRMGDLGRKDEAGRIWFSGRKAHRVETCAGTLFPVHLEALFNQHPKVRRTALVGVGVKGEQEPVLVVECRKGGLPLSKAGRASLASDILRQGEKHPQAGLVRKILFHPSLPVDARHNAKIRREVLGTWATEQLQRLRR